MSDIQKRARLPSLSSVHQQRATTISFEPEKWFVEDNEPRVLAQHGSGQPYPLRLAGRQQRSAFAERRAQALRQFRDDRQQATHVQNQTDLCDVAGSVDQVLEQGTIPD